MDIQLWVDQVAVEPLEWTLANPSLNLLPTLRAICPPLKVIACNGQEEACRETLAAGASAFAGKEEHLDGSVNTLRLIGGLSLCFVE